MLEWSLGVTFFTMIGISQLQRSNAFWVHSKIAEDETMGWLGSTANALLSGSPWL